jgi:hypothetical protein
MGTSSLILTKYNHVIRLKSSIEDGLIHQYELEQKGIIFYLNCLDTWYDGFLSYYNSHN